MGFEKAMDFVGRRELPVVGNCKDGREELAEPFEPVVDLHFILRPGTVHMQKLRRQVEKSMPWFGLVSFPLPC